MVLAFTLLLVLILLIAYYSQHLLLVLLLLEFLTFAVLLTFALQAVPTLGAEDAMIVTLFAVFVMEGVIALSMLIILVSHSGSDYLRVKNFTSF